MQISLVTGIISLVIIIGVPVGIFYAIKNFIRYNAQVKKKKSQQQEEIDKMNIKDL